MNRKKMVCLQRNSATDIFLFWDFGNTFGMVVFKVFSTCKTTFKVDIKSQIFLELVSLWCLYYNIWTRFIYLYVLEEPEVVARKSSIKMVLYKYFTKFTEKHLRWGIFCNKAASWWPGTSLNTESGTDVFSVSSLKSFYKNIYFANVSKGMPLKSKIFSGVSFRKILGFYCKQTRKIFNYEGISLQTLKIPERVNRIISWNSSELLLIKVSHQTKTCSMSTKKECFRNVILVSLWLAGEYFWRLWRSLIFVNLQVFI